MATLPADLDLERGPLTVTGLRGTGALAWFAAQVHRRTGRPLVCVTADNDQAEGLAADLGFFSPATVHLFPAYDIPPYTPLSPDPATVAERIAALYHLTGDPDGGCWVVPMEALLRRLVTPAVLHDHAELVIRGEDTDLETLVRHLERAGYEPVAMVQNVGEFSRRGGILDLYPPGQPGPVRLDFFGDTVESLRLFDPISQRSREELEELIILPARDLLLPEPESEAMAHLVARFQGLPGRFPADHLQLLATGRPFPGMEFYLPLLAPETTTFLDVLPRDCVLLVTDLPACEAAAALSWERITANHREALAGDKPVLATDALFVPTAEILSRLHRPGSIIASPFEDPEHPASCRLQTANHRLLQQELELQRRKSGLIVRLAGRIKAWLEAGDRVAVACRNQRRAQLLAEILDNHQLQAQLSTTFFRQPPQAGITLYPTPLSEGFDLPAQQLHLLSEPQLFGDRRLGDRKRWQRPRVGERIAFEELREGDFVVHRQHGIGVYRGLTTMTVAGGTGDYLAIEYREGNKLYVPMDRVDTVTKYKGVGDEEPRLDRLGSPTWAATRGRVKKEVFRVAQDLLKLYAQRQLVPGTSFSPPGEYYRELEESFPFDETEGQQRAIAEVLEDLAADRPMDRLVCGDVGYGKTEVAVRAAFKVMEDGFQVAMLVPTTVLAEQHHQTFAERFAGLPVSVACLNRFRSPAEQKAIVAGLADGSLDMVIGTHRLLSRDVSFRRLGLLIIDEEHRFGVKHKEKLKKMRQSVDVLTLTATPIPRTLQLSLLGIRDLSVIATPPARRRPVKTFVARQDDLVMKEAVRRELTRGGQVFVVHNRVHSITEMAGKIQRLVPEARVAVAHGQMPVRQLEEIMVQFVRREIDVLVCTTIIESGLDIPNANTIVITQAHRLGLAEIYQLRGRVGRGRQQAYAYLLLPEMEYLSKTAQQRLRALMDYNELGGGFKLAMSDLQIRGGGNLLGESQSGNIAAVGYDLYLELLQQTIADLKSGRIAPGEEEVEPEVVLVRQPHIPAAYIDDTDQRYIAYRRIAAVQSEEAVAELTDEFRDRYGPLPDEVRDLLRLMEVKLLMVELKISRLEETPAGELVLHFLESTPVRPEYLLAMVKKRRCRITPNNRCILPAAPKEGDALARSKKLLLTLRADAT